MNPSSEDMMRAYDSFCALMGYDENFAHYIEKYGSRAAEVKTGGDTSGMTLSAAIEKGLKEEAHLITARLVEKTAPLDIINRELIPALDRVGKGFEQGTVFLPQLLMSADAAKNAFAVIKERFTGDDTLEIGRAHV